MKICIALLLASASIASPASATVIFSGGFNQSEFSAKYDVVKYGSPFSVAVSDGVATIRKAPTPGGTVGNTFIIPRIKLDGDFRQDVTVDFADVNNVGPMITILASVSVNFGEGFEDSSQFATFVDNSATAQARHSFISDGVFTPAFAYPSPTDGKTTLRLECRGYHITSFYRNEFGSFAKISDISRADFNRPASFYISLNAYDPTAFGGGFNRWSQRIKFSW